MINIEVSPDIAKKEELLTDNLDKVIPNNTPTLLPKGEYLLKAIKDFSSRYDKDNRNILKNKKFLVSFDDLMTLIKDTINSQNSINDLNITQTEKLKDITQDFINNLSYTIFSFEKIETFNDNSYLNYSMKIPKKNSFNALNSKNNFFSNNKINANITVTKNNNLIQQNEENTNLQKSKNILYKKNKSSNNLIIVNSNKKQNNNSCKKNILSLNTLTNRAEKKSNSTYANFTASCFNKYKSGHINSRYDAQVLAHTNALSNTVENLVTDDKNNKINNGNNSSLGTSIPSKRAMTPKKILTQKARDVSSKRSENNNIKSTEKSKKSVNKNSMYAPKTINPSKNVINRKKNTQNVMGSFIDSNFICHTSIDFSHKDNNNNQIKNGGNDNKLIERENINTYVEFPKLNERKNHKENIVYKKDNEGQMRVLYKEAIDLCPKPSNMANKILENNRKYIDEFNAMKNEKKKEKKKK